MRSIPNPSIEIPPYLAAKSRIPLRMPSIILVNTFSEQNIGSISRIMLNFGLSDLRLVNPECDHLSIDAKRLAVGSFDVLQNAKVFNSLSDATADLNMCLATTSRSRSASFVTYTPATSALELVTAGSYYQKNETEPRLTSGIVFGGEKNGLSNSDLQVCNGVINIDTFEPYPVLNLAQAVNVLCYEMWQRKLLVDEELCLSPVAPEENDDLATQEDLDFYLSRLEMELFDRGFQTVGKNNNAKEVASQTERQLRFRGLQAVYKRARLSQRELQMLQGALSSLISKGPNAPPPQIPN